MVNPPKKTMNIYLPKNRHVVAGFFVLSLITSFAPALWAQPVVTFTASGSPGAYTLDFTVNNASPGSSGFDIYMFTIDSEGGVLSAPQGYYTTSYSDPHFWDIGPNNGGPFNDLWIDPTYTVLPTGKSLSGFDALFTGLVVPTSIQYYTWGENNGKVYSGPGNLNLNNPTNPFFTGNALLAVPEPATVSLIIVASLALLLNARRFRNIAVSPN
jgi:hypothetical protein